MHQLISLSLWFWTIWESWDAILWFTEMMNLLWMNWKSKVFIFGKINSFLADSFTLLSHSWEWRVYPIIIFLCCALFRLLINKLTMIVSFSAQFFRKRPRGVLISPGPGDNFSQLLHFLPPFCYSCGKINCDTSWFFLFTAGAPKDSGISMQTVLELGPIVPLFGVCMGLQCIGEANNLKAMNVVLFNLYLTEMRHQLWTFLFCFVLMWTYGYIQILVGYEK